ncbi:MAG TPA: hypothetical protein VKV33_04220 [Streptosporangiaceae bacterium]|jgi:hypothetical protein|nr:hypothetical protein [Streptosporangiaceae bacterium]
MDLPWHGKSRPRRFRGLAFVPVIAAAMAFTGLTAGAAQAAGAGGAARPAVGHAVAAAGPQAAAAKNYFILYIASEPPGGHRNYACNGGARSVVPLAAAGSEISARNNCNVRVWLYLNLNEKGRNLCIRPHSTAIIRRAYRVVWISRNTASC